MVSRLRRGFAALAVLLGSGLLTAACEKVPLLAPSGSSITLTAAATALPINGSTEIIAQVIEASGTPPHSGTRLTFTTNLGRIEPAEADTDIAGRVIVKFIAGGGSGTATITAISGGVSVAAANVIKIQIGAAAVGGVSVSASPSTLPSSGGTSTIIAAVNDISGNPLSGVPVTFAIDTATPGSSGSLSATVVTTDGSGRAQTSLTTTRTTTVAATAGIATTSGTTTTSAQTAKVTVTVNTTSTIAIGSPTPASPTVGQTVTLPLTYGTSTTASPLTRVTVEWGDGQTQSYSGQPSSISHAYRSTGSYLLIVTGSDAFGDTSTASTSITVIPRPQPTVAVTAPDNATPNTATKITIAATAASGSNATIQRIDVDFGDGSQTSLQGNATSVQHFYTNAGTYTITAVATDSNGATGSGSTVIVVGAAAPTADFSISPSPSKVNQTVSFNASDSTSSATITSYVWDFGDGSPAVTTATPNVSYAYTAAAIYAPRVTIRDSANRTATKSKPHTVNP